MNEVSTILKKMDNININLSEDDHKILCWALIVASLETTDAEMENLYCRLLSKIQDAANQVTAE